MNVLVVKEVDTMIAFQRFNLLYEFIRWNGETNGIHWGYTPVDKPDTQFFMTFYQSNGIGMGVSEKDSSGEYQIVHEVQFDIPVEWNHRWKDSSSDFCRDEKQFIADFFEFMEDYSEVQPA